VSGLYVILRLFNLNNYVLKLEPIMGIQDFNALIQGDTVENLHKTKAAILLL